MDVIVPNAAALRLPLGARKLVRFSRLKNSARNSTAPDGHGIGMRRDSARSTCQYAGPRTLFRSAFPNGWLGSVGITTLLRLNQFWTVRSDSGA